MDGERPPAFARDAYETALVTRVVAGGLDRRGAWVALADTVLYPEGGGQPSDRGHLGARAVVDVQRVDGLVRHYLADGDVDVAEGATVRVRLDWDRRFDHMQQHTAQHVLTAVAADRFGWPTTAFHLGAFDAHDPVADIELDVADLDPGAIAALEAATVAELRAARPIRVDWAASALDVDARVRSRGLPDGHAGAIRIVTIEGLDASMCGGTHVAHTAEVETIVLLGAERMRGGVRLTWVAGGRARRRLAAHEARAAALRGRLGVPDAAIDGAIASRLERLADAQRRLARLEDEVAVLTADGILAAAADAAAADPGAPPNIVCAHRPELGPGQVLTAARAVNRSRPGVLVVLTGGTAPDGHLVIAADRAVHDEVLSAVGRAVVQALEGRGGGRQGLYQGTVARPEGVKDGDLIAGICARLARG